MPPPPEVHADSRAGIVGSLYTPYPDEFRVGANKLVPPTDVTYGEEDGILQIVAVPELGILEPSSPDDTHMLMLF